MKLNNLLFFATLLVFINKIYAQTDPGDQILIGLKKWHDSYPQEKIFVQTDKETYLAGETIWLKAWCTIENRPTYLSRILYIEIIDKNGSVSEKKMYHLDSLSSANGVIDINKDLPTGSYSLNAYTLWMLNYPQFVFKKNLFVYNSDYKAKPQTPDDNQIIFFPEGGDMVEQVNGRVAFKAMNKSGFPIGCKGAVYDNTGAKIVDFQSEHDGMGVFELQTAANKSYLAKVTFANGAKAEYKLPVAKKEGATLQVQNTSPTRIFIIANRGEINKAKYNKLFVVAQINGNPVYKADLNFDQDESGASIIKKNLPGGIMQVTLFDSAGNPLAERLTFIDNHKIVAPDIALQQLHTNKRGQNIYSFRLDSLTEPNVSVLVVNSAIDPTLYTKENIASSFLLSSDIKGYIHNPGYYFANKEPATLKDLDLLLMTQGWRRFNWKQVKETENIVLKYPVESFMSIKGKVTKSDRPEPVTSGFVTFMIKGDDSTSILSNAYVTDKGEFIIDSLSYKSKALVSYQGTNNKNSQMVVDVTIYPAYIDTLKRSTFKPGIQTDSNFAQLDRALLPEYMQTALRRLDTTGIKVLQNIIIKGKKVNKIDSLQREYVSPIFENSDQTLVIPENRSYTNIWQYLNANVPGLNVNPFEPGGVKNVAFIRFQGLTLSDDDEDRFVKFLLNEIPVATDVIDALNPNDVALVKIYKGATGFAFGADAGAISVYTKKGANLYGAIFDKKFSRAEKIGYAITREFYNPDYTKYPELNKTQKDNRVVLYWNPQLKLQKAGNYLFQFHNSDDPNSFKVIIQGLDNKGRMIYKEQIIK